MKDAKSFWDRSAAGYAKSKVRNETTYQEKLKVTKKYLTPESLVLEFGCGTGSTVLVHAAFVKHILATDISPAMLEIAKQKAINAGIQNVTFQQGTLETIGAQPENYDVVLGLNILHLLEDVDSAIRQVHSLTKPGGYFISSTALLKNMNVLLRAVVPVLQWFGKAPFVNSFTKSTLIDAMQKAGFDIEYEWQPGKGSVFIVAKKPALVNPSL